jgi:trimethylamine:corrinoid methyltransferase-like protein
MNNVRPRLTMMTGEQIQETHRNIKFPPEIVEEAIKSAPKTIDVYDRRGQHRLNLGDDRLCF